MTHGELEVDYINHKSNDAEDKKIIWKKLNELYDKIFKNGFTKTFDDHENRISNMERTFKTVKYLLMTLIAGLLLSITKGFFIQNHNEQISIELQKLTKEIRKSNEHK